MQFEVLFTCKITGIYVTNKNMFHFPECCVYKICM